MQPEIRTITEKKLLGRSLRMSLAEDKTAGLWRSFMPKRIEIQHHLNQDLISLQEYPEDYFINDFDPQAFFKKWALAEVENYSDIPSGLEQYLLPGGLYAVFLHRGGPAKAAETFNYIFNEWLPVSGYELDTRPHFEVLGEKYRGDHPDSEEEIYIPVRKVS